MKPYPLEFVGVHNYLLFVVPPGYHGQLPVLSQLGLSRLTSNTPQLSQLAPRLSSLVVTVGASDSGVTRWVLYSSEKLGNPELGQVAVCCQPSNSVGVVSRVMHRLPSGLLLLSYCTKLC